MVNVSEPRQAGASNAPLLPDQRNRAASQTMGYTLSKLQEARFFLDELESHRGEHPQFDYYLSAFVSSARSVLWIMRAEYHDVERWENWYRSKKPDAEEASFLKAMNDIRVRSEKTHPLRTSGFIGLAISETTLDQINEWVQQREEVEITIEEATGTQDNSELLVLDGEIRFIAPVTDWLFELPEFPQQDILDVCNKYYTLIENLVLECEELFGAPSEEPSSRTTIQFKRLLQD